MNQSKVLRMLQKVNCLIPKKSNQIFLYSMPDYSDSPRAIYEYILNKKMEKQYSIVWAVKNVEKYRNEFPSSIKVVKHRSMRNFWHFARSKYLFRTHSLWGNKYDIKRQIMCITWHGMPLKSLLLPEESAHHVQCNIITSTAPFFDDELCRSMGLQHDVCRHVGLPRNDFLFRKGNHLEALYGKYSKYIIWMPTFRKTEHYSNGTDTELGIPCVNKEQLELLNSILLSSNYLLILKLHPWSAEKLNDIKYSNIVNLNDKDIPPYTTLYQLIGETDALITDYSSVYIDYMLIDKPICFVYDDISEYRRTRGFAYEPVEKYMPGDRLHDFESLVSWVQNFEKDTYLSLIHI